MKASIIDMGEARIRLIRDFNLAGRDGASNWPRLVRLAQQAGFEEIDFQRMKASKRIVEQWARGAGLPPSESRESFRAIIVETLTERLKNLKSPLSILNHN